MACRYTFNGTTHSEQEFKSVLSELSPQEASAFMPGVKPIPDAPFKKTWHELGLKRMIREAAENGFDSISWTTGAQQADRYDLAKHIDEITVTPKFSPDTDESVRSIFVKLPDGHGMSIGVDTNGIVNSTGVSNFEMEGKPLADVLGKEMAEKIMSARAQTVFKDLDLQVGGEGMKAFYDRMLVQAANRIGKKHGARVGETQIGGQTPATAEDIALLDELGVAGTSSPTATVHTLPITDSLRKAAMDGLPLFSAAAPAAALTAVAVGGPPEIFLQPPFVDALAEGEGEQQASVLGPIIRGVRNLRRGADEITRQRTAPDARPQSLLGNADDPVVSLRDDAFPDVSPAQFDEEGAPPLPDRAVNINLARLDTTESIDNAIAETARLFPEDIDAARRGVQTNEATAALADDMGMTVEQLLSRRRGDAFNAETALAARRLLASSAEQLVKLASAAADNGGDRELMAFRRAVVVHKAIQEQVSGLTAEAGRALQSFNILAGSQREMTRNVQEMIAASGGPRVSRVMAERLAKASEDGTLSRRQLNEVVRKGALARTSDAFLEVWINGLLSGPTTQTVNLTSNALVALWQVPTRMLASHIPSGGADGVARGEATALFYGMIRGYGEGLILAGRALRSGESTDVLGKIDLPQRRAISSEAFNLSGVPGQAVDLLGETIRIPGRLLLAGDELFKSVGYRMEVNAQAFRTAASEGLTGDAMAARMDEILRNPPEDIRLAAIDAGRYQTFTKPLGEGGRALQMGVNAVPAMRLVVPFIRTPVNIMKFVGEGTVLAPLSKNVRAEIAAGGARRQIAIAKIAMGSMASALAADLAARGLVTGNGPSNPDARQIWLTTHQANSIKIGDEWVAYGRLEPIGAFFGIAADIQMIMGDLNEEDRQNLATALVVATSKNVTSKTYLRGLSEAMQALDDPDRYGPRYIRNLAGTAIPTGVAQVARSGIPGIVEGDPVLRDVRTIYDKMRSRIPGMSDDLPPRRNIWGEPIVLGGGLGPDIMSPFYTNAIKADPVSDEMVRLEIRQQMPSRQIAGVALTPEEYSEYTRRSGEIAKDLMADLIQDQDYIRGSEGQDGLKVTLAKRVFQQSRAIARAQMLEDPEFRDLLFRAEEAAAERSETLSAPAPDAAQGGIQLPGAP